VRCGAPNPKELTTDDWRDVLAVAPHLLDDPKAVRESLTDGLR